MAALALDTHAIVKDLKSTGLSEAQAEAITSAVGRIREVDFDTLANKADVASIRTEMATKLDLQIVKGDLEARIANLESSLLRWVLGAIGFQTLVVAGAILALNKGLH